MKKILFVLFVLALSGVARADDAPPVVIDENTPGAVVRIADGLHVLDNATVATFYDALHGVPLVGSITTPYKKYYTSVDLGVGSPLTKRGQNESATQAEFLGGVRFHAGEFLYDRSQKIKDFVDGSPIKQGILQYSAVGVFYSRDWSAGLNMIGPYGGFEVRW